MKKGKLILSIGMIFKNELRCLERCLKSLTALRETVPCELVMADTGSTDGSREIAEKYADILFDFPWVNDFSAARNAVMERCSGMWYMSIDADEWLDEDISELAGFLRSRPESGVNVCGIKIRNYANKHLDWHYSDFTALRLLYLSSGIRFQGRIHETLEPPKGSKALSGKILEKTVLHHDGYVMLNDGSDEGREKLKRNMQLLQKSLEESPENLKLLEQCIESCGAPNIEAQLPYIYRAVKLIQEDSSVWKSHGASVMRHAVHAANKRKLPEMEEWLALAESRFPDSIFTKVEIQFDAAEWAWNNMDCPAVIRHGMRYLEGVRDYRAGRIDPDDQLQSPLQAVAPHDETTLRGYVARAQVYEGQPEQALETLGTLDYDTMDGRQVSVLLETMVRLHSLSQLDTAPLLQKFWEKITTPKPSQSEADERKRQFLDTAAAQFTQDCLDDESARRRRTGVVINSMRLERPEEWNALNKCTVFRYGYTLFRALNGLEIHTAALLMDEADPDTINRLLGNIEHFDRLPIQALIRALLRGAVFPPPGRMLNIEEMDTIAAGIAQDQEALRTIAEKVVLQDFTGNWQKLLWVRGLVLAAVRTCGWKDADRDMTLANGFVKVEQAFLTAYYTPAVLQDEGLCALPVMHRFGWYCVQAFNALEAGDTAGYVAFLRKGLAACAGMKEMVSFLLEHTPEVQAAKPNSELLFLAEKVRIVLDNYPADDPAVLALKQSPAYQKVAHLIEGPEIWGGLAR